MLKYSISYSLLPAVRKDGTHTIRLRVSSCGKRMTAYLPYSISTEGWDDVRSKAKSSYVMGRVTATMINNTYNAAQPSLSEQLIQQYEARIREKDERISELKERIEDQRKYISILSDEHKSLVHQAIGMLSDNNTRIMDIQEKADEIQQIGYRFTSQLDNTTNESERYK